MAVECEEDSISINISLVGSTWADVIADSVRQLLWHNESARAFGAVWEKVEAFTLFGIDTDVDD